MPADARTFSEESADLERLAELARGQGDRPAAAAADVRRARVLVRLSKLSEARSLAEAGLALARELGDRRLEGLSLADLGFIAGMSRGFAEAAQFYTQGQEAAHAAGDGPCEARCMGQLAVSIAWGGLPGDPLATVQRALALAQQAGDREIEGEVLNVCSLISNNWAETRSLTERALAAARASGSRGLEALVVGNLGATYVMLGLYARAADYLAQSAEMARRTGSQRQVGYALDNLVDIRLQTGDLEGAAVAYAEMATVVRDSGDRRLQAIVLVHGAQLALARGELDEAARSLAAAAAMEVVGPAGASWALAWLGAEGLAAGDLPAALAATAEAAALLETHGGSSTDYPTEHIWWWRYRALRAAAAVGTPVSAVPTLPEWAALDRARAAMLEVIAGLNDDGLRRNYLNKIPLNRQIVEGWLAAAREFGLPFEPLTTVLSGLGGGEEQFRRLLDIGVRLNEGREGAELPWQIMIEVVELTGAERAALVLMDAEGGRRVAAQISPVRMWELGPDGFLPPASTEIALEEIAPLLDECERQGSPLLRYMPEGAAPFEQCSILVVPLVAVGKLVGLVYTELGGHFGRFNERDRDLLSVLANQAAVAVENANWAGTLEQRVRERTAELTIINSIGEAMARQLDVDTITKIVGDKVREIFQAEMGDILLYDAGTGMIQEAYAYDRGDATFFAPFPLGQGLTSVVIRSRRPLVLGTHEEQVERGAIFPLEPGPGEEFTQSHLGVPIIVGERVIGVVSVQSYRRNAYDEAAVRLLSTLAANMGVAIENARLFQETRRLLAETEQRGGRAVGDQQRAAGPGGEARDAGNHRPGGRQVVRGAEQRLAGHPPV